MKTLLFLSILFLSGCQSYHEFCASQSLGPDQEPHIRALNEMAMSERKSEEKASIYVCEYFPAGMGGFSSNCVVAR